MLVESCSAHSPSNRATQLDGMNTFSASHWVVGMSVCIMAVASSTLFCLLSNFSHSFSSKAALFPSGVLSSRSGNTARIWLPPSCRPRSLSPPARCAH